MVDSQNMNLGLWFLNAQVVYLFSADFWASKDIGQAPHVRGSITI